MSEDGERPVANDDAAPEQEGARTTVRPPFDPEQFARESDSRIAIEAEPPSDRPTAPPPPGLPPYAADLSAPKHPAPGSVGPDAVPSLTVARDDLDWFELPRLARELLVHVDGRSTLAILCERCGFALDAVTATCQELDRQGIVTLHRRSSTSA